MQLWIPIPTDTPTPPGRRRREQIQLCTQGHAFLHGANGEASKVSLGVKDVAGAGEGDVGAGDGVVCMWRGQGAGSEGGAVGDAFWEGVCGVEADVGGVGVDFDG